MSTIMSIIGGFFGSLFMLFLAAIALLILVCVLGWALVDAEDRGKPGWMVVLLILFLQIPGLLIWLVFRPEKIAADSKTRSL